MKLKDLLEAKEKSLIGHAFKIAGQEITLSKDTEDDTWPMSFDCQHLSLTSLEGVPKEINGHFNCSYNDLTSLEFAPKIVRGMFSASNNLNLTSLPKTEAEYFIFNNTALTSLKDVHKHLKFSSNSVNNLLEVVSHTLKSHVLGVLLIDNCRLISMSNKNAQHILNKYLPNERGHKALAECQEELIEAGLDEFAQI